MSLFGSLSYPLEARREEAKSQINQALTADNAPHRPASQYGEDPAASVTRQL